MENKFKLAINRDHSGQDGEQGGGRGQKYTRSADGLDVFASRVRGAAGSAIEPGFSSGRDEVDKQLEKKRKNFAVQRKGKYMNK